MSQTDSATARTPDSPAEAPQAEADTAALAKGGRTNFFGFILRLVARLPFLYFAGRWYGARQALLSVPRAFVSNIVAILAARRAIVLYLQMLRSGAVIWDKTDHHIGEAVALTVRSGRGE